MARYSGILGNTIYRKEKSHVQELLKAVLALPGHKGKTAKALVAELETMQAATTPIDPKDEATVKLQALIKFYQTSGNKEKLEEVANELDAPINSLQVEKTKLLSSYDEKLKILKDRKDNWIKDKDKIQGIEVTEKIQSIEEKIKSIEIAEKTLMDAKKELDTLPIDSDLNPTENAASIKATEKKLAAANKTLKEYDERDQLVQACHIISSQYAEKIKTLTEIKTIITDEINVLTNEKGLPNPNPKELDERIASRQQSADGIQKSIDDLTAAKNEIPASHTIRTNTASTNDFAAKHQAAKNILHSYNKDNSTGDRRNAITSISPDDINTLKEICDANKDNSSLPILTAFADNVDKLNNAVENLKTISAKRVDPTTAATFKKEYDNAVDEVDKHCAAIANQLNPDQSLLYTSDDAKGAQQFLASAYKKQGKGKELVKLTTKLNQIDELNKDDEPTWRLFQKVAKKAAGAARAIGISDSLIHEPGTTRNKIPIMSENFNIDLSMGSNKKLNLTVYDYNENTRIPTKRTDGCHPTKAQMKLAIARYNTKNPDFEIKQGTPFFKPWVTRTYCGSPERRKALIEEINLVIQEDAANKARPPTNTVQVGNAPTPGAAPTPTPAKTDRK